MFQKESNLSLDWNNQKIRFTFVIINYNSFDYTNKCLNSIKLFCRNHNYEIIVIDNASMDDSSSKLAAKFTDVIFINNKENYGFARACNQGIDHASGEFIIFLNNDFEFTTDIFDRIIDKFQRYENLGLLGFQLLNPDGTVQKTDFKFPTIPRRILQLTIVPFMRKHSSAKLPSLNAKDRIVDYIKGALMIIPAKLLNQLQLRFDENYFMYHEEMDLAFQLRKQGKICILDTTPAGIHHGQHAEDVHNERVFLWRNQNYLFFLKKNYGKLKLLILIVFNLIVFSLKLFLFFPNRSLRHTYLTVIIMNLKAL